MPKVHNPPPLPVRPVVPLDHLLDHLSDGDVRPVENARIRVSLDGNRAVPDRLEDILWAVQPVEADDVVAKIAGGIKSVPCALGEDNHGDGIQTELLEFPREMLGDISKVWLGEFLEGRGGELAGPGVENLDQLKRVSIHWYSGWEAESILPELRP